MGKTLNLRLAEQHKAVREASVKRVDERRHQPILYEPHRNRYIYEDGSEVSPDDPRLKYRGFDFTRDKSKKGGSWIG